MDTINLFVAGFTIRIVFLETEFPSVKEVFKNYINKYHRNFIIADSTNPVDLFIEFTWDDKQEVVVRQKEGKYFINFYRYKARNKIRTYYQISFHQFNVVLRNALHALLSRHNGFFLHASASCIGGANIFVGKSGTGKSTVSQFLKKKFQLLADDAVIIKRNSQNFSLYQTPFLEKNYVPNKLTSAYPLQNVFFLKKAKNIKLQKIKDESIILENILQQTYSVEGITRQQIRIIKDFIRLHSEFYYLYFPNDPRKVLDFFTNII